MYQRRIKGLHFGKIKAASGGSMFAGKTEYLLSQIKKITIEEEMRQNTAERLGETIQLRTIGAFKHPIDKRYSDDHITSHNQEKYPAKATDSVEQIIEEVQNNDYRVVVIDEIQFYNEKNEKGQWKIVEALNLFVSENRFVIVAGLCRDFRGEPFVPMGDILALADDFVPLKSICAVCGAPATMTQRLIDGKPAFYDDPIILVGAKDSYEPRCRSCHELRYREDAILNELQEELSKTSKDDISKVI